MASQPADDGMAERLELSRPADLPSVEVLLAEQCARRWRVFHETYTVCTVFAVDRLAEWTYRRQTYDSDAGSLALMEPGEVHANPRVNSGSFRVLFIDPALMERGAHDLGAPSPPGRGRAYDRFGWHEGL